MTTVLTTPLSLPLTKLVMWEGNVRKTNPEAGIGELSATIASHGLLHPLVVRKDRRGKFAVVAGGRRFHALQALAEEGTIGRSTAVPCTLIDDETNPTEISLVENVHREPMHPADEFEAFKTLIDGGMPAADVAARFGVSETVVLKRLKLAQVSPSLIEAYRSSEMTLQHVMAFAVSNDHAAQERVWNELSDWQKRNPDTIRKALTENAITSDDPRVRFVTLKAYEKAGGEVRRDLFSEGEDGVFIDDLVTLEALVARKLENVAKSVRKQGWKWAEVVPTFDYADWAKYQRRYPLPAPPSPEQQDEMHRLTQESDGFYAIDELDDEQRERLEAIQERLEALNNREATWPCETLAVAGAIVALGHDGKADIHCGYVRPEDAGPTTPEPKTATEEGEEKGPASLSAALIENLTAQRSAAINAALLERSDIALATLVHAMAVFYHGGETVAQVRANAASLHRVKGSTAYKAIEAVREQWAAQLPSTPERLLEWCLEAKGDTLRGLLTFCVAQCINAILLKSDQPESPRMRDAELLAEALGLDMSKWFTPTAENYFSRVSKAHIIAALAQAKGAEVPAWNHLKKAGLASLAERETAGTGWLPELLRCPSGASASGRE